MAENYKTMEGQFLLWSPHSAHENITDNWKGAEKNQRGSTVRVAVRGLISLSHELWFNCSFVRGLSMICTRIWQANVNGDTINKTPRGGYHITRFSNPFNWLRAASANHITPRICHHHTIDPFIGVWIGYENGRTNWHEKGDQKIIHKSAIEIYWESFKLFFATHCLFMNSKSQLCYKINRISPYWPAVQHRSDITVSRFYKWKNKFGLERQIQRLRPHNNQYKLLSFNNIFWIDMVEISDRLQLHSVRYWSYYCPVDLPTTMAKALDCAAAWLESHGETKKHVIYRLQ